MTHVAQMVEEAGGTVARPDRAAQDDQGSLPVPRRLNWQYQRTPHRTSERRRRALWVGSFPVPLSRWEPWRAL